MYKLVFLALLLCLLAPTHQEIQLIDLPLVSRQTQNQVNYRINYLKLLLPTYNWLFCNKIILYRAAIMASHTLHKAACEMKNLKGNHVEGHNNFVAGRGLVVIGSNNEMIGINSWCFTSNYQTPAGKYDEGILAIGNYKIALSRSR